jgi:hypothetical protein
MLLILLVSHSDFGESFVYQGFQSSKIITASSVDDTYFLKTYTHNMFCVDSDYFYHNGPADQTTTT